MPGKFELFRDKSGKFHCRLKVTHGQVVGTGEQYETERACANGIKSVAKNAPRGEGRGPHCMIAACGSGQ